MILQQILSKYYGCIKHKGVLVNAPILAPANVFLTTPAGPHHFNWEVVCSHFSKLIHDNFGKTETSWGQALLFIILFLADTSRRGITILKNEFLCGHPDILDINLLELENYLINTYDTKSSSTDPLAKTIAPKNLTDTLIVINHKEKICCSSTIPSNINKVDVVFFSFPHIKKVEDSNISAEGTLDDDVRVISQKTPLETSAKLFEDFNLSYGYLFQVSSVKKARNYKVEFVRYER